jgi:hypothetical protein
MPPQGTTVQAAVGRPDQRLHGGDSAGLGCVDSETPNRSMLVEFNPN